MLLSKSCENAIRAITYLVNQKGRQFVPVKEIAAKTGISFHFLGKILQTLTQNGLLKSYKGPNGGMALAKPAAQIRVIDIIEVMDGLKIFEKCIGMNFYRFFPIRLLINL